MTLTGSRLPRRIYVERDGIFWSFEPEEWLAALEQSEGPTLHLPEANELTRRPATIQTARGAGRERCLSTDPEIWVVQPTDWDPDQRAWHKAALAHLLSG